MARQTDTAHDVDLEVFVPQGIVNIKEFSGTVDTHAVDQNIRLGLGRNQCCGSLGCAGVTDYTAGIIPASTGTHLGDGDIYPALVTTDDRYLGASPSQASGNCQPDTSGGTGNDGRLS